MSVQLVLCVADSVWRAAGHLVRVCMPAVHSHRACLLKCRCCCWLCPHISLPVPRPQLVMAWLC